MYRFHGAAAVVAALLMGCISSTWAQANPGVRLDLSQDALKFLNTSGVSAVEVAPGRLDQTLTPRYTYASLSLTTRIRPETLSVTTLGGMPSEVLTQGGHDLDGDH